MGFLRKKNKANSRPFAPESTDPTKIRVVKFKPGTEKYPLRVRIKTVDLTSAKYAALSYVKNPEHGLDQTNRTAYADDRGTDNAYTILCDGTPRRVDRNLWYALSQLHSMNNELPIWIDSLCIDLNNRAERAAETSVISHIYGRASHMIVWLGNTSRDTKETLFDMKKLVNSIDWRKLPPDFRYDFTDPRTFQYLGITPISGQQLRNLFALCNAKWFSRMWSFYELASANQVMFLFGDSRVDYPFLSDFARVLELTGWLDGSVQANGSWSDPGAVGLSRMMNLATDFRSMPVWHPNNPQHVQWMYHEYGQESESQRAWTFFEFLLQTADGFDCDDPRDRIFAPLALARKVFHGKAVNKEWPLVDYSTPVDILYTNIANLILRHTRKPSMLNESISRQVVQAPQMNHERLRRKPIDTM